MAIGGFGKGALAGLAQWGVGRLTPQQAKPATPASELSQANSFLNILVKLRADERARERLASELKTQKQTRRKSRQSVRLAEEKAAREKAEREEKKRTSARLSEKSLQRLQEGLAPASIFWGKPAKPVDKYTPTVDAATSELPAGRPRPELDILAGAMLPTKTTQPVSAAYSAPIGPVLPTEEAEKFATPVPAGKWRKVLGERLSESLLAQGQITPQAAFKEMNAQLKAIEKEDRDTKAAWVKAEEDTRRAIKKEKEMTDYRMASDVEKFKRIQAIALGIFKERGLIKTEQDTDRVLRGLQNPAKGFEVQWTPAPPLPAGDTGPPPLPLPTLVYTGETEKTKPEGWNALTQNQKLSRQAEARELAAFVNAAAPEFASQWVTDAMVLKKTVTREDFEAKQARLNDLYAAFPELKAIVEKGKKKEKKKGKPTLSDKSAGQRYR